MASIDLGSVIVTCDGTTITCNTDVLLVEDVVVGEDGSVHLAFPLCDVNVSLRASEWADLKKTDILPAADTGAEEVVPATPAKRTRRSSTTA